MLFRNVWLKTINLQKITIRSRSKRVFVPLSEAPPFSHMRRLFDTITEPILPTDSQFVLQKPAAVRCRRPVVDREMHKRTVEFSQRELAYINHLRKHLSQAVVVILCHEHPTDQRLQHYDLMDLSAAGIAMAREYSAKVTRAALRESPLERFSSFFDDDVEMLTSLLYVKRYIKEEDDGRLDVTSGRVRDGNYLPTALRYAKQTNWLVPLAVVYEDRLLSVIEAEQLATYMKNPLQLRAETVAMLNAPMAETGRLLSDHGLSLSSSLQSRIDQLKNGDRTPPKEG